MGSLTEANLKKLAGARSFERALGYLDAVPRVFTARNGTRWS